MKYQICQQCVMDTTDIEIIFDENGICNHCKEARESIRKIQKRKEKFDLENYCKNIKEEGRKNQYDCIIGISGGIDSCYVMYLAKKMGLRPLAVHIDNGWNSELAVQNIKVLLEKLEVDLYTYVVDWQEFRDLQLAFLKASTPDSEIPTDHMIRPVLGTVAHKYKCKYIIMGQNSVSEFIIPRTWSHGHSDWKYIKNIYREFGTDKLKTFPYFTRPDMDYFSRKYIWFNMLDFIDYNKDEAKMFLREKYSWRDYGGKHYESLYTKFYQSYILPVKFGYDKRRMHLSSLIAAGQIEREEALQILKEAPYDEKSIENDIEYFVEKMQITRGEFEDIMKQKTKSYWDYPNNETDWMGKIINKLSRTFMRESR